MTKIAGKKYEVFLTVVSQIKYPSLQKKFRVINTFLQNTFFYINRTKYWFCINFRFLLFDRFTLFGMSQTRFDYFRKMFVCLCVIKKIVTSVARELIHRIL